LSSLLTPAQDHDTRTSRDTPETNTTRSRRRTLPNHRSIARAHHHACGRPRHRTFRDLLGPLERKVAVDGEEDDVERARRGEVKHLERLLAERRVDFLAAVVGADASSPRRGRRGLERDGGGFGWGGGVVRSARVKSRSRKQRDAGGRAFDRRARPSFSV
jgi:hypothetical protein